MARWALILSLIFGVGPALSGCELFYPIIHDIHYAEMAEERRESYRRVVEEKTRIIESGYLSDAGLVVAYFDRGEAHYNLDQYKEVIEDFDATLRLHPHNIDAWRDRGRAHRNIGQYDEAIRDFSEVLRQDPGDVYIWNDRAEVFFVRGQIRDAISDYDEALHLEPNHFFARINRGRAYFLLARFSEAVVDLRSAVRSRPEDHSAVLWLYLAEARGGQDGRETLMWYSRLLDVNDWPGPVIQYFLGRIGAHDALDAANSFNSRRHKARRCQAFFFLGQQALLDGNSNAARRWFKAAVDTGVSPLIEYLAAENELARLD